MILKYSHLTAEEQRIICAFSLARVSLKDVKHTERTIEVVYSCLKSPESKEVANRCGRPRKITDKDLRKLLRVASNTKKGARRLPQACFNCQQASRMYSFYYSQAQVSTFKN